jgi:hypothetical protein
MAPETLDLQAQRFDIPFERDHFLCLLIRELAGTLEHVVGVQEPSGYIRMVGTAIGEQLDSIYRDAFAVDTLSKVQVADVLVDLKRRIEALSSSSRTPRIASCSATAPALSARWSRAGRRCAL